MLSFWTFVKKSLAFYIHGALHLNNKPKRGDNLCRNKDT